MLTTPSFRLDNKSALVVGASSGIGQACAIALAEYGASVTIAARRQQQLLETQALMSDIGAQAKLQILDITHTTATQQWLESQPAFDIALNAAGLARHTKAIETTEADFDAVSQVNFKAAYFFTQAVARQMIAAKKAGSIIHISSQMAHVGGPERAVYAATKHALEGMTKSMAIELGEHQIRINTLCPTFIKTNLTASTFADPQKTSWIKQKIKLGRIGEVTDIMGAAVFLASDASALITGTSIRIDGGWTAG